MSYCRNNGKDSDVYIVATCSPDDSCIPGWWCCGCKNIEDFFLTREKMIEHLLQHRKDGDKVPESALERLRREIAAG